MSRPIKIAFVIDQLIFAGAQRHIISLAKNIPRAEFIPYIICLMPSDERLLRLCQEYGIEVFVLGLHRIYGFFALRKFFVLIRWFRKNKIGIVQTYLFSAHVYATPAAWFGGVRCLISARRATVFWNKFRYRICRRFANSFVNLSIANSPAVRDHVLRYEGIPQSKITIIPNGVDVQHYVPVSPEEKIRLKNHLGFGQFPYVCGTVAHLSAVKGVGHFIRMAREVCTLRDDAVFLVIGKGKKEQEFRLLAEDNPRIHFLGERTEVLPYLQIMDLFFLLSDSEGMSNALLEAMACGITVCATSAGGNTAVLQHDYNGFLVEPFGYRELAQRTNELLQNDAVRNSLGQAGRRTILEKFTLAEMVHSYVRIYKSFLKS